MPSLCDRLCAPGTSTLSLHDALPISSGETLVRGALELRVKESDRLAAMAAGLERLGVEHQLLPDGLWIRGAGERSEEHTSELQSHSDLVCRLLLEKKNCGRRRDARPG